jgi:hypothetical protein
VLLWPRALTTTLALVAGCLPPLGPRDPPDGCPPGAGAACRCRPELRLVLGACLSPRAAAEVCGPTARVTPEGCGPLPSCPKGSARDVVSGACLPRREVRALASSVGLQVADGEVLVCPAGWELLGARDAALGGPGLACAAAPSAPAGPACPAGSLRVGDGCARVLEGERVDVARWLRAAIGPDGGLGAPLFCEALARAPWALSPARQGREERATVELLVPDNDLSQTVARVGGTALDLERAILPMVVALRGLGDRATGSWASTTVRCRPGATGGRRPVAGPENDDEN